MQPKTMEHLDHVNYPASKQELVEACNQMSDVPAEEKKWFMDNLPDQMYNSAEDVKQTLSAAM